MRYKKDNKRIVFIWNQHVPLVIESTRTVDSKLCAHCSHHFRRRELQSLYFSCRDFFPSISELSHLMSVHRHPLSKSLTLEWLELFVCFLWRWLDIGLVDWNSKQRRIGQQSSQSAFVLDGQWCSRSQLLHLDAGRSLILGKRDLVSFIPNE